MRRRTFLSIATAAGLGASVGAWQLLRSRARPSTAANEPPIDPPVEPPPAVSRPTLDTLVLVAEAMAGIAIEPLHYEQMFTWRAEHVDGYKLLLEQFVRFVGDESQRLEHRAFAQLDRAGREHLLETVFAPTAAAQPAVIVKYRTEILRDILVVFGQTDALVAVGYDGWEGTARGYATIAAAPRGRPP